MDIQEMAMKLTGLDVGSQFDALAEEAREMDIAFVFCSGNMLEAKGTIEQTMLLPGTIEVVCFNFDGKNYIIESTALGDYDDADGYERAAHEGRKKGWLMHVTSRPSDFEDLDWIVTPQFKFEPFMLMSQGKPYCRGAVFMLQDETKQNLSLH
jgi:hypothetical protein